MKELYYNSQILPNGLSIITVPTGVAIKNHLGVPLLPLSENISLLLCQDLNEIHEKNQKLIEIIGKKQKQKAISLAELYDKELNESLVYCMLSSLIKSDEKKYDLDIQAVIQWDRVFRLNPGPVNLQLELSSVVKVLNFFDSNYVNLELNYASSLEEMKLDGIEFVPKTIVKLLTELTNAMSSVERFAVQLLYNYFNEFSITLPILWVAGRITNKYLNEQDLVYAYWVFENGIDPKTLNKVKYESPLFIMERLRSLKKILNENYW
jgi:hypothetical protein